MNYAGAHKLIISMVILSFLSLVFMGAFPWTGDTYKTMDKDGDDKEITSFWFYTDFREASKPDEAEKIGDSLAGMFAMAWLQILFALFALMGLVMVRLDFQRKTGNIFLFLGSLTFIFAILVMVMNAVVAAQIADLAKDDIFDDHDLFLAYNYVPVFMSIFVLIFGIMLFMKTGLPLLRTISAQGGQPAMYGAPPPAQQQYQPAPAAPPPQDPYSPPPPPPPAPAPAPAQQQYQPAPSAPPPQQQYSLPPPPPPAPAPPPEQPETGVQEDGSVVAEVKEVPEEARTETCLRCMAKVPVGNKFCPSCGNKLF